MSKIVYCVENGSDLGIGSRHFEKAVHVIGDRHIATKGLTMGEKIANKKKKAKAAAKPAPKPAAAATK